MNEKTLAFSAIIQAVDIIDNIAQKGFFDTQNATPLLQSLLITNADNTLDILGGDLTLIKKGLEQTPYILGNYHKTTSHRLGYIIGIMKLSKKVMNDKEVLSKISSRFEHLKRKLELCGNEITHSSIIETFADIYVELISPVSSKIKIIGNKEHLMQPHIQAQVRALLLTSVRLAILWRQLGGSQWDLLFKRGKTIKEAQEYLNNC